MREARTVCRSLPLQLDATPEVRPQQGPPVKSCRRSRSRARLGGGVRFDAPRTRATTYTDRVDTVLPLIENVLQAAGYLVLTVGAVALLFRFAP